MSLSISKNSKVETNPVALSVISNLFKLEISEEELFSLNLIFRI